MKRILLLSLLLLPIVALAQYPTFSNKQKLGVQTTGDGLIFRGSIHPNYYTPSNINNAYFYLDTTTSKLYLYNDITWQQIYPTASDTISLGAYLLKSDTLAMLLPYLRKSDTISLSNRINNKLSLADTASMLLPYLKLADTTSMLAPYFRDSDTTMLNLITRFNSKLNTTDTVSLSNRINLKLNNTDTINLSNRIDLKLNKSDTISLSNRIDIKLNASDTVSLSNRINKKLDTLYVNYQTNVDLLTNKDTINITTLEAGSGINITNNVISLDTTLLDSVVRVQNVYVKNGTGTVLNKGEAVYVTGADGTNIVVGRASNVAESSSSKTLGLTMTSIPVNGFGYVIKEGLLAGLNTNSANDGDPIWLSNIPGGLIFGLTNKPYAPNHLVYLGIVTRKQQNNGEVYVTVQNGFEIKELHDVQIIDPVNKASLYYNSSQSLWRDTTAALLVSDTVSMLSKYVNTYSNQTGINGDKTFNNVVTIDSATVTGKLLVNTNISDAVKISSNTNSTNLELMNSSGTVSIKSSNKNMILQTDTTALVYLNGNNKKVGILTMNPQQELEVAGNVRIDSLNNNIVPTRIVGSDNNGDLTNVNLGEGLSFINDTLKVDLTIIDTAIAASSITLAGHVTGTGSTNSTVNTTISNGVVTNDMLAGGISDTKLNTITTAGKVDNSATTATSSPINNTIVLRNGTGDFTARNITATNFYGLASTATLANTIQSTNTTGIIKLTTSSNSVLPIITVPDVNATMATTNLSQTFSGTQTFSNTISGSINGNAATVTSVLPSNFASQTANTILAAPNGSSGTPTFRSLVSSDIPSLNYLPLTGGTLTGGLTGTTGTFNTKLIAGNIGSSSGSPIFTAGLSGTETEFHILQGTGYEGSPTTLRLTNNNGGYYQNGLFLKSIMERGLDEYNGRIGIMGTDYMILNKNNRIGIFNTTPSTTFDVNGTFKASGNSLIGGTLGVTGATTLSSTLGVTGVTTLSSTLNTSGLITSSFTNISNYSTNATDNNAFTIYNNTTSTNNIYGGLQFLIGENSGAIPGGPGLAQIYGIRAGGASNPSTDLTFSTKSSVTGVLEKMRIKFDGKVGIGTTTPSYLLDVNGQIGSTGFIKSGGLSTQFLKANGSVDANTYLTTSLAASTYLPLAGGTISGSIRRQDNDYNNSPNTFYFNMLNYNARPNNNITNSPTAQLTFTDRPGTSGFPTAVRTSDIYLMTAKNWNGSDYGVYLDTTLSVVANQDGGRVGISKLNPAYKLDVNGTLGVTGATTLSNLEGTGTRMVVANNTGVLSTQAIPTGTLVGTDTVSLSNRINTKVGLTGNETINGTKTFGGLIVPTNGMMLTATGNNSNKLLGLNVSSIVGEITLGSGLSLSNNVLSVNGSSGSTNIYALKSGTNVEIIGDISAYSNIYVNMNNNSTITVTLPPANINTNKTVILKNIGTGSVISNNTNIEPLNSTGLTNIIMTSGGGKFATLISDGTNWIKMSGN